MLFLHACYAYSTSGFYRWKVSYVLSLSTGEQICRNCQRCLQTPCARMRGPGRKVSYTTAACWLAHVATTRWGASQRTLQLICGCSPPLRSAMASSWCPPRWRRRRLPSIATRATTIRRIGAQRRKRCWSSSSAPRFQPRAAGSMPAALFCVWPLVGRFWTPQRHFSCPRERRWFANREGALGLPTSLTDAWVIFLLGRADHMKNKMDWKWNIYSCSAASYCCKCEKTLNDLDRT